ncbi:DUF4765 family protein [Salmonella enterica]|uniref:DUF4765 family protein n=1 Tax=Salmonella enterica TaxID=28901 RepID=UPI003D2FC41A
MTKDPASEIYQEPFSDTGKNAGITFYRSSDSKILSGIRTEREGLYDMLINPYSELREGDIGYDEDLLDISDDSPLLEGHAAFPVRRIISYIRRKCAKCL